MRVDHCKVCQKMMIDPGARKYCSNACRQKHYRQQLKAKRGPALKPAAICRCRYCGQQFQSDNPRREYCTPNHRKQNYREQRRLKLESELDRRLELWTSSNAPNLSQKGPNFNDSQIGAIKTLIAHFEQPALAGD